MNNASVDFRANCMDYIRLWAALTIVYGHSTHWLSVERVMWFEWVNIFPGLMLLFVLSGYLVTASVEHSPGRCIYLWRRFIRMYPALWVAFGVSTVAVAVMTRLYEIPVSIEDWGKWIAAQLTVFQFYTPPDLKAYGMGNPNGALWMIPLQLCMYVAIMLTYKPFSRWSVNRWVLLLIALGLLNVASPYIMHALPEVAGKLYFCSPFPYAYIFYVGMFVYVFREKILPLLVKYFWCILALYVFWVYGNRLIFHLQFGLYIDPVQGGLLSFLTIATAYKFGKRALHHDYSYSIYLYHEIFVNILMIAGFVSTWWAVGLVYACTLFAAVLTCRLVEEPVSRWLKR